MSNPPSSQDPTKKPTVLMPESPRLESPTEDPALLATSPTTSENSKRSPSPRQPLAAATRHPLVRQASSSNVIAGFSQEAVHVFWAGMALRLSENKVTPFPDNKFLTVHIGRKLAQRYRDSRPKGEVVLMEDLEGKNGALNLTEVEKDQTIDGHTMTAICAAQSISFAKSASGSIVVSVADARETSFFRKVELPVISDNKKITDVVIVSINDTEGTKYPKEKAFEILTDQWLKSSIERYKKAALKKDICPKAYEDETKFLAKEIVLIEQRRKELFLDTKVDNAKIEKEQERLRSVTPLIIDSIKGDKALFAALEKEEVDHGLSDLDRIVSKLSRKPSFGVPKPLSRIDKTSLKSADFTKTPAEVPLTGNFSVKNPMILSRPTSSESLAEFKPISPRPTPNPPLMGNRSRTP